MTVEQLELRLQQYFPQCDLMVTDLTGTEDHYEVRIAAKEFKNLSRIRQHQLVMEAVQSELKTGEVHALSIRSMVKE